MVAGVVMDWLRPQDSSLYQASSSDLTHLLGDTSSALQSPDGRKIAMPIEKGVTPFGPEPRDAGGSLYTYFNSVLSADLLGREIRISGTCISACTIYLGARNVCVEPDAVLWFHAAHDPNTRMIDHKATQQMASYWPEPVRDWARRNRALERIEFTMSQGITGRELINMGVKRCG